MESVREQKQDVLLLHALGIELVQTCSDGDFPVACGLASALYDIGDDEHDLALRLGQIAQRGHSDGVADGLEGCIVEAVPVLRKAGWILYGFSGDEDIGVVGQIGCHLSFAILKLKFHVMPPGMF